jgi:hypothetical protein
MSARIIAGSRFERFPCFILITVRCLLIPHKMSCISLGVQYRRLKTTALKRIPIAILFAGHEGDLDTERKALLLIGHLNLALCYLKLQDHVESRDQCDKALKLDPSSEKGLFRRLVTKHKNVCLQ